jgi:serine/threonine-protein kinase
LSQALPNETANPLIGRVLAERYLLREVLAEGGMATVYRATRVIAQDQVAVKVMHPHFTRDRSFGQRFRREAQIAWKLAHPSIVRVIDHGVEGQLFFMVMELLDGEDLFDVLRHEKRLDPGVARRILADVCDALAAAHAQGIVHRDLKPENVFLSRAKGAVEVKVLDFGVAKMMLPDARASNESEPVLTAMGALLGTPEYLSPEMCRGEPVGPGADLYACGALLHALLTGRPPFVTDRPLDVTMKHITETPRPPSEIVPGLDPALDAIVLRALAKQPEERQASATAFAEALRALGPLPALPATLVRGGVRTQASSEAVTLVVPPADDDATLPAQIAPERPDPPLAAVSMGETPLSRGGLRSRTPALAQPAAVVKAEPATPGRSLPRFPALDHASVPPPPPLPVEPARPVSGPPAPRTTVRPLQAPAAERSLARIMIAVVVLAATFAAGVAVGRGSATYKTRATPPVGGAVP